MITAFVKIQADLDLIINIILKFFDSFTLTVLWHYVRTLSIIRYLNFKDQKIILFY